MVFVPMAQAPPKAGAKNKVLYSLQWQSKFDPWVYILVFAEAIKAIAQMNTDWQVEKAQYAEFNVPTCGKIAVWQLYRERQPLWNSHDGLNLTCLDQCHGVRSHGKSSSQSWRKRIATRQSEFDPWVYILVFAEGDLYCLPLAKRFCAKGYEENDNTMTMAP